MCLLVFVCVCLCSFLFVSLCFCLCQFDVAFRPQLSKDAQSWVTSDTDSSIVNHKSDDESPSVYNNTLIINLSEEEFEQPNIPSDDSYHDSPGNEDDVVIPGVGGNVSQS